MGEVVSAFTAEEEELVLAQLTVLAPILANLNGGGKLEEGHWAQIYRTAKGYKDKATWSNLPFHDYIEDGLGVESKLLHRKQPSGDLGKTLMHPSATRTLAFDPLASAEECKRVVLEQWGTTINDFIDRTAKTSPVGSADIRWGILLWTDTLTEFLYFEETIDIPNPDDFTAVWHEGSHRGNPTRNLWIYEVASGQKRYSVTLPENGAKLQPYFDIPTEGYHLFEVEIEAGTPVLLPEELRERLEEAAAALGLTPNELLVQILGETLP